MFCIKSQALSFCYHFILFTTVRKRKVIEICEAILAMNFMGSLRNLLYMHVQCISVNTYISEYMSVFLCGAGWTLRSPFRWWQPWPYNWSSVSSNCRPRPPSQSQWGRRRLHQPHPPRPRKATNLSGDRSGIYSKTCLSDCLFCRSCIYI